MEIYIKQEGEIWKSVVGYESMYEVSNLGRIKRINRTTKKDIILKQITTRYGYKRIGLYLNKVMKLYHVHRIVAIAFLKKPIGKNEVNHIDRNKTNNAVYNLEWCTQSENVIHGWKGGRISSSIVPVVKLSIDGKILKEYLKMSDTKKDGYNWNCVGLCCRKLQKQHKGYLWKYKKDVSVS